MEGFDVKAALDALVAFLGQNYLPLLLATFAWFASGCALINTTQKPEASSLPAPPLPASSVVLEVAFARLPLADEAAYSDIWSEVDEQHFPTELRRQMSANGLRCGIVGMQLPPKLKEALDASEESCVTSTIVEPPSLLSD